MDLALYSLQVKGKVLLACFENPKGLVGDSFCLVGFRVDLFYHWYIIVMDRVCRLYKLSLAEFQLFK
jgi:hypothetical protein